MFLETTVNILLILPLLSVFNALSSVYCALSCVTLHTLLSRAGGEAYAGAHYLLRNPFSCCSNNTVWLVSLYKSSRTTEVNSSIHSSSHTSLSYNIFYKFHKKLTILHPTSCKACEKIHGVLWKRRWYNLKTSVILTQPLFFAIFKRASKSKEVLEYIKHLRMQNAIHLLKHALARHMYTEARNAARL